MEALLSGRDIARPKIAPETKGAGDGDASRNRAMVRRVRALPGEACTFGA